MSGELNFDITVQLAEAVASFDELSKKSEDLKRKLDELSASKADPRAELKDYELVKSEMDELKTKLDLLNAANASPEVVIKRIEETRTQIDELQRKLDVLNADRSNPEVSLKEAEKVKTEIDDLLTKLKFLSAVKATPEIAVKDAERAKTQIQEVHQKLDDLDLRASNMVLGIRTDKAKAEIGAFATQMTSTINAAIKAIPNLDINGKLDATDIESTAAELRAEFQAMRDFTVKGSFDDAEFMVKLKAMEAELRDLSARSVDVKAKFDYVTAADQIAAFRKTVEKKTELAISTEKASTDLGAFATKMRATMEAAIKSLPDIVLHEDDTEVRRKNVLIRAELEAMHEFTMHGNFDDDEMLTRLHKLKAELDDMASKEVDVRAKFDSLAASADIAKFLAMVKEGAELKVKTDQADADIGAFATSLKTKLDAAIKALPSVKITGDSTDVDRKIDEVKTRLQTLKDLVVTGKFDNKQMLADIKVAEAELKALADKKVNVRVTADTSAANKALADTEKSANSAKTALDKFANSIPLLGGLIAGSIQPALASIGQLSGALGLLPSVAAAAGQGFAALKIGTMGVSASIKDFTKLDDLASKSADANAKAQQAQATASQANTTAGQGTVAMLKQLVQQGTAHVDSLKAQGSATKEQKAAIAGAQQQLDGYKAALINAQLANQNNTAAQGSANAATAQAKTATSEAATAQKAYDTALENYRNSLTNLAPAAKDFVVQIATMSQSFKDLKLDVQQHLFEGLATSLKSLSSGVLPTIQTGLNQMADAINTAAKNVTSFVTQQSSVAAWKQIFSNNATAATTLAGAIKPILQIITDVTQVGSQFLPQLAQHFADAAAKAAEFVANAKQTGQLAQWIQSGLTAVKDLWDSLKNVVVIIKDLATVQGFGPNFLQALKDVTAAIRWITDNLPLGTAAVQAFIDAWLVAKIISSLTGMVTTIGTVVTSIKTGTVAMREWGAASTAAAAENDLAAASGGRITTAIKGVGAAVPILGAAVIAATAAWSAYITSADSAAAAMLKGGQAAQQAAAQMQTQQTIQDVLKSGWVQAIPILGSYAGIFADKLSPGVKQAADAQKAMLAGMDPLTKAQTLQTQALNNYLNDLNTLGPANQKTIADFKAFQTASDGVATAQDKVNAAMSKTAAGLQNLSTAITGSVTAEISYKSALDALNTSVANNTNTTNLNTQAGRDNVTAVATLISSAQAYEAAQKKAGASDTELSTLHQALTTSIQGVITKLGLTGPAVDKMVAAFTAAKPALDLKATLDTQGVTAGVAAAKAALATMPRSWQVKIAGETADLLAKVAAAGAAVQSVPTTHTTTFTGDGANLLTAAAGGTTAIQGVVPDWLTKFAGDTANLVNAATTGEAALEGVKSTHGSTFTGDASGLITAANTATTTINAVAQPAPTKFTADITDITAKTATATTQIAAVVSTHPTTLTGDLTGATGVTQSASDATKQINAIPATHKTTLTIDDAAALQAIQQFTAAVNAIPTQHVTTLTTVTAGAGGMIVAKMASGGVIPMAKGGTTPMSASKATIVPPNTMRLIGDRPIGDEAFIPINNSGVSQAILGETAQRMGKRVVPLHGGGRSWGDNDDNDFWSWWHRNKGGGGGSGSPSSAGSTLQASAAAVSQMYRATSTFQAVGGAASISSMKAYHQNDRPMAASAASTTPPPVKIHCDSSNLGRLLFELFRNSIRSQGGNVQVVLGT